MITRFSVWFLLVLTGVLFFSNGYAQNTESKSMAVPIQISEDQIAAKVNDVPITKDALNRATVTLQRAIAHSKQFQNNPQQLPMHYIQRLALDVLITNELIYQKAIELGLDVTDEELAVEVRLTKGDKSEEEFLQELSLKGATLQDFYDGTKKSLYVRKVIMKEHPDTQQNITTEEAKKRYSAVQDKLSRDNDMIDISHIMKAFDNDTVAEDRQRLKETLQHAKKLLDEGAQWNEIVRQYSDNKEAINGNLGYVEVVFFPKHIQQVLRTTPVGSITDVVEAEDGFHLIKINDLKEKGGTMTFAEAQSKIKDVITMERIQSHYMAYVQKLQASAKIEKFVK